MSDWNFDRIDFLLPRDRDGQFRTFPLRMDPPYSDGLESSLSKFPSLARSSDAYQNFNVPGNL